MISNRILFYNTTDEYGCFSNFSKHPIFLDGTTWITNEHYYQGQKFLNHEDRFAVQIASTPFEASNIGRDRKRRIRNDWESVRVEIMRKAVFAKVMQHEEVRNILLSTGDSEIVEHTESDNFWGDGGDGQGANMLGKILMDVRITLEGLSESKSLQPFPPWIKYPHIEYDSVGWRMGIGEDYLQIWHVWFLGLSKESQKEYMLNYPPPKQWTKFYLEYEK